jgi:hypothetical protein
MLHQQAELQKMVMASQIFKTTQINPTAGYDVAEKGTAYTNNYFEFSIIRALNGRFVVRTGLEGTRGEMYAFNTLEEMRDGLLGIMTKHILEEA